MIFTRFLNQQGDFHLEGTFFLETALTSFTETFKWTYKERKYSPSFEGWWASNDLQWLQRKNQAFCVLISVICIEISTITVNYIIGILFSCEFCSRPMENEFSAEKRNFKYIYLLLGLKCSWINRQKKPCNEGILKYSIFNENHECSSALRGGEKSLSQWRDGRTVIKFSMRQTNRPLSLLYNILRAGRTGSIS